MHIIPIIGLRWSGRGFLAAFLAGSGHKMHQVTLPSAGTWQTRNPGLHPARTNLVIGEIAPEHERIIAPIAHWWPPIIPLRDPLLSAISARARDMSSDWRRGAENLDILISRAALWKPLLVPLDRLTTVDLRARMLGTIWEFTKLGSLRRHNAKHYPGRWASGWPHEQHNSLAPYPLKTAYFKGEISYIEKEMESELAFLRAKEPVWRPFLEKCGYRDLIWWS